MTEEQAPYKVNRRGGMRPGAGRPEGSEYSKTIRLRVTPHQFDVITKAAKAAGMTVSEYARIKLLT